MKIIKRIYNKKINKKSVGFTLVELLVVIGVIAILAGMLLVVINPSGVRAKARDSQRKADLNKIQVALELYFADNRRYPSNGSGNWTRITGTDTMSNVLTGGGYLSTVPSDPNPVGTNPGPCSNADRYRYNYTDEDPNRGRYMLTAIMEVLTSNDDSQCDDLSNWGDWDSCGSPFGTVEVCYGVQNP